MDRKSGEREWSTERTFQNTLEQSVERGREAAEPTTQSPLTPNISLI